jgi:formaldehyde-activating enzyme involved in methanogenesis
LQRLNINKLETARNKITFRKSESVVIGESFIKWAQDNRADLLRFTDPTADKTAIKQALKEGAEIEGAYIESKQNIQIK